MLIVVFALFACKQNKNGDKHFVKNNNFFIQQIQGSNVSLKMLHIPAGSFMMGSPENEEFRSNDESPQRKVYVNSFYMSETEVTWDVYLAFYNETKTNHRNIVSNDVDEVEFKSVKPDAISGPTPFYGNPDRGWGMGSRPVISISWHAANTFCVWLSSKTGKKYRLPTEAEWEYACRAGTNTPYFFQGNPTDYSDIGFWKKFFVADTSVINSFVVYKKNALSSMPVNDILPNAFGLKGMLGNVAEFCSDFYAAYLIDNNQDSVTNPKGPLNGNEYVVRGGSYRDDAADLRSAKRSSTQTDRWLKTDPQIPKSIWWYSDCFHVGFRVVCED